MFNVQLLCVLAIQKGMREGGGFTALGGDGCVGKMHPTPPPPHLLVPLKGQCHEIFDTKKIKISRVFVILLWNK